MYLYFPSSVVPPHIVLDDELQRVSRPEPLLQVRYLRAVFDHGLADLTHVDGGALEAGGDLGRAGDLVTTELGNVKVGKVAILRYADLKKDRN